MSIPVGETIGKALKTLRANIKTLIGIWVLSCILPGLFISAACSAAGLNSDSFAPGIQSCDPRIIGALILISLVWIGSRMLAFAMIAVMCAHSVRAATPPFKPILFEAVSRLASAVGTLFLVLLAWLLGLAVFVLPGLYLLVRFSLALSSVCVEGCSPIPAMRRSWTLTRGNFWSAAGLLGSVYGVAIPLLWVNMKFNAYVANTIGAHGSMGGALAGDMTNTFQFLLTIWISAGLTSYLLEVLNAGDQFTTK